jgi:prevent-host-death family protein
VKTASAAEIAAQFNYYLEASREQPILITRNGKPAAVLLAVRNKAQAEELVSRRPGSLRSVFEKAHAQLERGEEIAHDEFWRQAEESRRAGRPARTRGKK